MGKQSWNDYRLAYGSYGNCYGADYSEYFSVDEFQYIWRPDSKIANLVDEPTNLYEAFWIKPNGDVEYFQRLTVKLSCKFDFYELPSDTQNCQIIIQTRSDDKSKVIYEFYKPPLDDNNPDGIAGSTEYDIEIYPINVTQDNNVAVFNIKFQRNPDYYNHFVLVPVVLMVVLGWA